MSTSKEVFALRKAGQLDEAYRIAVTLNDTSDPDIWDIRALAWCLVDLVDMAIAQGNYQNLPSYCKQLERIDVDPEETRDNALIPSEDRLLISRRNHALSLISQIELGRRDGKIGTVITYKDIYAKRKQNIDEAYQMALKATSGNVSDEMELHALAWCLVDLIKRDFRSGNYQNLERYRQQLQDIQVDERRNDVLAKQKNYALSMCDPLSPIIFKAQEFSKQENYFEAINCYNKIYPNIPQKYQLSFGWDLYRCSMQLYKKGEYTIPQIKRYLFQYLKLNVEKPSLLHSVILRLAKQIAKLDKLDIATFLCFWGVENFRSEDFEREQSKDGHLYPALAEDVFQRSIKSALKSKNVQQIQYLIPYLKDFIERYPDNEWLIYYKAKALVFLGHNEEAQKYCISVCKHKTSEFWAWSLLGDSFGGNCEASLACYAKALLCPSEEDKTINLRIKTALCLAKLGYKEQSKLELSICQTLKPESLPDEAIQMISQEWFQETIQPTSNTGFYVTYATKAEELLLADIPWIDAVIGDVFTIKGNENKKNQTRRRVYLKSEHFPREVSCRENKFPYPDLPPGSPIRVKGEDYPDKPYKIMAISKRDNDKLWDIFPSSIGIINFINNPKKTYHVLIDRNIESFFHFDKINNHLNIYDFVDAKIAIFKDNKGEKYNIAKVKKTNSKPNYNVYKEFSNETIKISGEIGFTESDIFIPRDLVIKHSLSDDVSVSGKAILNYNKKRSEWGWKAIDIHAVTV